MADEFEKRVIRLRNAIKLSRNDPDDDRLDGCSGPRSRATPQLFMPLPLVAKVTHNHGEALQISVFVGHWYCDHACPEARSIFF